MDRTVWFESQTMIAPTWLLPRWLGLTLHQHAVLERVIRATYFGSSTISQHTIAVDLGISYAGVRNCVAELVSCGVLRRLPVPPGPTPPIKVELDILACLTRAQERGYDSVAALRAQIRQRMGNAGITAATADRVIDSMLEVHGRDLAGMYQVLRAWHVRHMEQTRIPITDPDEIQLRTDLSTFLPATPPRQPRRQ